MTFEKYTADLRGPQYSRISIYRNGKIAFSATFCRTNQIGDKKYVVLYYDRNDQTIAFRFLDQSENMREYVTTLYSPLAGRGASLRSFFPAYGLNVEQLARPYVPKRSKAIDVGIDAPGDVYIIKLQPTTAASKLQK